MPLLKSDCELLRLLDTVRRGPDAGFLEFLESQLNVERLASSIYSTRSEGPSPLRLRLGLVLLFMDYFTSVLCQYFPARVRRYPQASIVQLFDDRTGPTRPDVLFTPSMLV